MRGFPRHINVKQDLINLLAMPEFSAEAKAKLIEIEAQEKSYLPVRVLGEKEEVTPTKEQRIVEEKDATGAVTKRTLEELKSDPNSRLAKLGYTSQTALEAANAEPLEEETP